MRIVLLTLLLIGCAKFDSQNEDICIGRLIEDKVVYQCPDGSSHTVNDGIDGTNGIDGINGIDGAPGVDAVIMTRVTVPKNTCTAVGNNIYVENINGKVFDVYYNKYCADAKGEYCDNVVPAEPTTGSVVPYQGSGTVCWADNIQLSGLVDKNKNMTIYILEFTK